MAGGKPSAFRAQVEVNGAVASADKLEAMGMRAMNTLPLMEMVKEMLFEQQKARVEGTPWVPLKDSTVKRKVSQGQDPSIMRGEWRVVKGSATRIANKLWLAMTLDGATGQIKRATRTTATFGVDSSGNHSMFYARFAQNNHGTQRRLLAISAADATEIVQRIGTWVYEGEKALRR